MRFATWENPRKKGEVRIYVNKLIEGYQKGKIPKFWLENEDGVAVFRQQKAKGACIELEEARKLFRDKLEELGFVESSDDLITWELALTFPEKGAEKKKTASRKARTEGKVKSIEKQATKAAQDAFQLDLTTIKFDDVQTIIVDHREPQLLFDMLSDHKQLDVKIEALELGDIKILRRDGSAILIERKDCDKDIGQRTDFEASVIDDSKRLFTQSERMKFEPDILPIFLLEGDVYNKSQSMLVQQIDGALSFLAAIQKTNVMMSLNLPHTAYMVTKLCQHFTEGLGYELNLRPKKPEELLSSKSFVLEGIPGVSGSLARDLLSHFGSIKNVSLATIEELIEVDGVGPKKAITIFNTLNE